MRLVDLDPRWFASGEGRHGMGVSFDCPCPKCQAAEPDVRQPLAVRFANPLDGGAPFGDGALLWQRTGETFETLTLTPSVDASGFGHWHGWVKDGEAR